jgi:hypothetical protein
MDIDLEAITLAALLTTAGSTTMAAIITGLVAVLGRLFRIDGHEARLAAVLTALFVLTLAVQAVTSGAMAVGVPLLLACILGWYAVTRLAMAIHDDVTGHPASLRSQT